MTFAAVQVGSVMEGPSEWRWITIVNPSGIKSGNANFTFGDDAGIQGGTIKVIVIDNDRVLCQYVAKEVAYGSHCPTGAFFFLDKVECQQMLTEFEKNVREQRTETERLRAEKEHVKMLLQTAK